MWSLYVANIWFAGLTRNVYRWSPIENRSVYGLHTIDERINMEGQLQYIRFYYDLIRNFDASDA